ncbi:HAMP domain-containing sensor histidine kinase [Nonomuraea sp. NPDC049709]|uniref:sensor histidine kinase n=1 Tax=Nonomuraea sp. NPDC049709 TaxID=3154736 RepID=UPI0034362C5F
MLMLWAWRDSLRARLMVCVILLAALGMGTVSVASLAVLRIYLSNVADANLAGFRDAMVHRVAAQPAPVSQDSLSFLPAEGTYVALLDSSGRVIADTSPRDPAGRPIAPPDLPSPVPPGYAADITGVAAAGSPATRYRALVFAVGAGAAIQLRPDTPATPFSRVVIAESLGPSERVLFWLLVADTVTTIAALAGIALLSRGVLRVGLRPLRDMATTATAIAAGDVHQRIGVSPHHAEIDEVGDALNRAFDARQRAEERLRQFVADASHELRTPLATIRGWAQLHLHGLAHDPELVERAMLRIEGEAARMHGLVEELLLLARLDQGSPHSTAPVDLGKLATAVVTDTRNLAPDRTIALHTADPAIVDGDADRLLRVLHNLLNNALQHTPAGTPVAVTVRRRGSRVELSVTDRGPGMPADVAGKIFERFYRGDGSRSPESGGTGLGLSIVRSIVEAHAGTVTVRTSPGEGAVFTVLLPAGDQMLTLEAGK